jgi:hypothetical protein
MLLLEGAPPGFRVGILLAVNTSSRSGNRLFAC